MKKEIGQPNIKIPAAADLATLELKANLNPEQRAYLEVLKDQMRKILGNKTKQELAKAGDLVSLKNYRSILEEILEFLQTKKMNLENVVEDPELIRRQLWFIDTVIAEKKSKNLLNKDMAKALEVQRQMVQLPKNEKIKQVLNMVEITAAEVLSEKEVLKQIREITRWASDHYYLIQEFTDKHGNLFYCHVGIAGRPDVQYLYALKGNFEGVTINDTKISQISADIRDSKNDRTMPLAVYDEKAHIWALPSK